VILVFILGVVAGLFIERGRIKRYLKKNFPNIAELLEKELEKKEKEKNS
jgi:uncharacterized protein YneF (UPF0154 family)